MSPIVGLLGAVEVVEVRIPPPTTVPPILTEPPIPTPPAIVNAPVTVLVELVVPGIDTLVAVKVVPLNVNPLLNAVMPAPL